ncbi:hypothetical protein rpr22_0814 [Rickettsia prowazekii str. Rp22]|uniref:Uncharacterized protein n=1 Tax=Rickettsia prowazekii (strain Rp22) TaxID=449216 RepID=D5AY32_RICPP|nr:hypothetical protein rpr22_0814 [Rickettsia prowazekii str. Rp22]EOB09332.1 hypothetical protein H377_6360 [Rickettsia prowazekii str. Cairo 3]
MLHPLQKIRVLLTSTFIVDIWYIHDLSVTVRFKHTVVVFLIVLGLR